MKIITVNVEETNYGFLEIEVSDNATKEEIDSLTQNEIDSGNVIWNETSTSFQCVYPNTEPQNDEEYELD